MVVQTISGIRLSRAARAMESSAIRDLLRVIERPDVISLAGGLPAPETFPLEATRAAVSEILDDPDALQYSATEGFGPLRAWLADRANVDVDRVLVVHGSQQGLDLVARALVDPGDDVVLADPGYVGAIQAFRLAGANLVGVPSDSDGLCVDRLQRRLAQGVRPAFVYVIANFDNPTGTTLSLERRIALVDLADRYGFTIVEDDPYGELRWSGAPLPSLASSSDQVVTLGTVSKVLCPGMRVGHVTAPKPIADALVLLKQAADLHTSTLAQRVVHRIVTTPGFLEAQIQLLRNHYESQSAVLVDALTSDLGDQFEFTAPDGGMFVWGSIAGPVDTGALLTRAVDAGVAFVPGAAFAVEAAQPGSLRLSFATARPADLRRGVQRLASVV
jgi:2-aminoadipate transaminase